MSEQISQFMELLGKFDVIDLTYTLENKIPTFPSHSKFLFNRWISPGDPALVNVMIMGDHAGTHFDAPAHFLHDTSNPIRKCVDEIDPMALTGHAVKLTFGPFPAENCTVGAEDIQAWEKANLEIQPDDIVILDYQWGRDKWKPTDVSNEFMEGWPGLSQSGVDYLMEKKVRVIGTDCASIDAADGAGFVFPGHFGFLPNGYLVLENLKDLHKLPVEFIFMALPLKIKEAGGSPIRALALVPKES